MSDHAITAIGFDADDTLWQNEHFYRLTEQRFTALLEAHGEEEVISSRLLAAETRNLALYGFGIKGFTLSMIETAIEITEGRVDAAVISEILAAGRELLTHPVETLPHARDAIERLSGSYRIILITKGDLFDQERKLAQSGLGDLFDAVEIVSDKTVDTYRRVFARHADGPERALMVGNSLKSDIAPAISAGGWGVYVPHPLTWSFEHVEPPTEDPRFRQIADLGELPDLVRSLD
ncbi:HAD family hydrolase [Mesorhizobium sp. BR1-1-16]|uniref:HAD family hydrolase n=1 Tax=Mesorhizobium sp. BR1-1-16 TaxID=2876653 RepID=UPI001CC90FE0|nr:HAD family hydrolase [Mesorhizobium sp. BR1-1-16]MBZ9935165.1 HAD family hydrolase [Mesorhizobium sp. BR1-1-16]